MRSFDGNIAVHSCIQLFFDENTFLVTESHVTVYYRVVCKLHENNAEKIYFKTTTLGNEIKLK